MSDQTAANALQISNVQFPIPTGVGTALAIPPRPASQVDVYLGQMAGTPTTRRQLVAKALLGPEALTEADAIATRLFPEMLNNSAVFMEYGKSAVAELNALIDRLLEEVEPVDIPELTEYMDDLRKEMRRIRGKYDLSNPEVYKRLQGMISGARGFFQRATSLVDMLWEDAMELDQQLDRAKGFVADKGHKLLRNALLADAYYQQNEREIINVIGGIAVMELIREKAIAKNQEITVEPANPADHQKSEQKRMLAEFVSNLEVKIAEYRNRLYVGWTFSPQITNIRWLNIGLANKLDLLTNLTIPVMKATILQWRLLIEAQQGAEMGRVIAESANEWLVALGAASAQAIPVVAEVIQTPSLTPQTVFTMAQYVEAQADAMITAYQKGREKRAIVESAIMQAKTIISDATTRVSDEIVATMVGQTNVDLTPVLG